MNKREVIYFTPNLPLQSAPSGVRKKVDGQAAALAHSGWKASLLGGEKFIPTLLGKNLFSRIVQLPVNTVRLSLHDRRGYQRALSEIRSLAPAAIYIRYSTVTFAFIEFLRRLRAFDPPPKVIMEIATWPYDRERNPLDLMTWEDRLLRSRLRGLVDRIVTVSDDEEILGVPTIMIRNGITVDTIPYHGARLFDGRQLNLIGVANISFWHGYDRLLRGLAEYRRKNSKINIQFNVVGEGAALGALKQLSADLDLNDTVHFLGFKSGEELDDLFQGAHIGIGSLGLHRLGIGNAPILKHREYCARCLPFIISNPDDGFPDNFPFVLRADAGESPLDILQVIEFYERIRPLDFNLMRDYAVKNLDWNTMMRPVVSYLRNGC